MKAQATRFEDLMVRQKAHQFMLAAYRFTRTFHRSETYGLSSQLRRAAVSVAANIAEGFKKREASCWRPVRRPFWILTPDFCLSEQLRKSENRQSRLHRVFASRLMSSE